MSTDQTGSSEEAPFIWLWEQRPLVPRAAAPQQLRPKGAVGIVANHS